MKLDLASESSIRSFAAEFQSQYPRLDVLVCNAGQQLVVTVVIAVRGLL